MADDRREPSGAEPGDGWLDRLMQRFSPRNRDSARDDLAEVLAESAATEDFSAHERALLGNVLAFHRVRVGDIMVPRSDIVATNADATLGEVMGLFRSVGHSRLPVYGETLDEPLGMVHIRDLVNHLAGHGEIGPEGPDGPPPVRSLSGVDLSATLASASILRPVLFVPGAMPAIDLLVRMQASRTHIALVIDEYGGTDGLVSIEDLVESVVGDIEDEHDQTADRIARENERTFLVDARADLEEVSEALGGDLTEAMHAHGVDTLGGLLVRRAGRVPLRGERFAGPDGLEFEVVDADRRRLKRIRIRLPQQTGADDPVGRPGSQDTSAGRDSLTG